MNINFIKIFFIIAVSSIIGIIANFFDTDGVPFVRTEKEISFADDSFFTAADTFQIPENEPEQKTTAELNANEKQISEQVNPEKYKPEETEKNKQENPEITKLPQETIKNEEFSEPKAIHIDQAYRLFNNNVIFIDAREPEDFKAGHIKGAINIPFYADERNQLNSLKKDEPVVVYCSGTDCDLSILLGDELFEAGYKKVFVFFGGWNDWLEKNYPAESQ